MQKTISIIALFLLISVSAVFGQTVKKSPPGSVNKPSSGNKPSAPRPEIIGLTGEKAPTFITADMNGAEINLENLRDKIVVMNLWGTFCLPCVKEIPKLNALVEEYKGKDVVFLAPTPENKLVLEEFLRNTAFKYQVLPDALRGVIRQYALKKKVVLPTDNPDEFTVNYPTHLVIDRDGTIVKYFLGYNQGTAADKLRQTIKQLLAKKGE